MTRATQLLRQSRKLLNACENGNRLVRYFPKAANSYHKRDQMSSFKLNRVLGEKESLSRSYPTQTFKVVSGLNKFSNSFSSERVAFARYFSSKSDLPPHQISPTMTEDKAMEEECDEFKEEVGKHSKLQLEFQDLLGEFKLEVDRMSEIFDLLTKRQQRLKYEAYVLLFAQMGILSYFMLKYLF